MDEAESRWPGLRVTRWLGKSLKSIVFAATREGVNLAVKRQIDTRPLWRWYFEREVAIYRAFAIHSPPTRAPLCFDSDADEGWLLLEHIEGSPLARFRLAPASVTTDEVRSLVEARTALASWNADPSIFATDSPDSSVQRELRSRLLEDPSAPIVWCTEGLAFGASLGLIDDATARRAIDAIETHPTVVISHGDLLPRNVMRSQKGLVLIDWECAGFHPEGWDLALLWSNLSRPQRAPIDDEIARWSLDAQRAFWACVVFALVRELKFRRGRSLQINDPRDRALRDDVARARTGLLQK